MDQIEDLLTRGVANIIPGKAELTSRLESGEKLNVYFGVDPTATKIHLGTAVGLRKLQKFAELGHHVTFLIGDFTTLIGDTSDKNTERPILTNEEIEENFKTYKKQAEKILDFSKITVRHNSEWLKKLTFEEIVKLCQHFSMNDFISRELIRKRLDSGNRVALHEVLYPIMQGYDSYFMDTDIQLGGTDQTFNMQAGRTLQKDLRNKESFVMSTVFLEGTDGRKMSKSWGNAIWLEDNPEDMYAKVMAVHDDFIINYYLLGTNAPASEVEEAKKELESGAHPMDIKKRLAKLVVTELHTASDAEKAAEHFQKTVQDKEVGEVEDVTINSSLLTEDILVTLGLATSKSDAKRLFEQGGVSVNGEKSTSGTPIASGDILKVGKRNTVRLNI
jgi:tyrosyl-tRNA synthetase